MNTCKAASLLVCCSMVLLWGVGIFSLLYLSSVNWFVQEKSITILAWPGIFDREYVKKFEETTGIKVYLSFCSSNEELIVKLRATGGKGCDLVTPSDYAVGKLREDGLLKKLDKKKLSFIDTLNPLLLGHFFDPHNDCSLPFSWELYCIGVNTDYIDRSAVANPWDLIFTRYNGSPHHRVVMTGDSREAALFATQYLYGKVFTLSADQKEAVKKILIEQKPFVETYTNVRADYYLGSGCAHAAIVQTCDIWRAMANYNNVDFMIPRETFVSIEHCSIPAGSNKDDLVYQFLNFFYTQESFKYHAEQMFINPARLDVIDILNVSERQKNIMRSSAEAFSHYAFIREIMSEFDLFNLWAELKS